MALAFAFVGCDRRSDEVAKTAPADQSVAIGDQEDAVCGMMVREQSAPRAQVVHRDGSRFFFCSLADLLVHLSAPSPHGRAEVIYVEVMKPDEDPMQSHTEDHPWVLAKDAVYVVGIERRRIMGKPVLVYASRSDAERAIQRHQGQQGNSSAQILDLAGLSEWWKALTR